MPHGFPRERGRVESFAEDRLVVETAVEARIGDSVAVDGVCLTVVANGNGRLAFDVVPETRARAKSFGAEVNLEAALRAGDPLGGHIVQGHVDVVGHVRSVEFDGEGKRLRIEAPPEIIRYCVEKGSIAVEGVSLTISSVDESGFEIALVPHTLDLTTLGALAAGDPVNLEVDMIAKYVERLVGGR